VPVAAGRTVPAGDDEHLRRHLDDGVRPLLKTVFPSTGFTTISLYENFNSGNMRNPCPVRR
jgi:hypothetical protein